MKNRRTQLLFQSALILAIVILVNIIASRFNFFIDLTEDKRFTLESSTLDLIDDVDDIIYIDVLLEGELNSSFTSLRNRLVEILNRFSKRNPNISFAFSNPSEGSIEEINNMRESLRNDGVIPTTLFMFENDQRVEKLIYPYAIINFGDRRIPVNLLEPIARGENEEQAVNRSAMLLEYKLASSIAKLMQERAPIVMFTEGNGELEGSQTAMLETLLSRTMRTGRINLDSTYYIDSNIDLLIVARPQEAISQRSQFILDQYLMKGGKIIWLIDQFYINLDSINNNKVYVPKPVEHGLDDMFFKYGLRINRNVVLDLENSKIPQVYGMAGNRVQQQLFPWVFHPLLQANPENAIVKNIDRVASTFPSTIEVLEGREGLSSQTLLTSSRYSRFQVYPSINISFEILRLEQRPEAYNKSFLPVAVLLEGEFESLFKNRVSQEMLSGLQAINETFIEKSPSTQQVFIADSDIIKNLYDPSSNRITPMGYNKWEEYTYEGNEDFIINTIDFMLDDYGLVNARSKNYKLRLLDQVKLRNEKLKWQVINMVLPVVLVILGAFVFAYLRRRRYTA